MGEGGGNRRRGGRRRRRRRKTATEDEGRAGWEENKGPRKIRENEHGRETVSKKYAKHARVSRLAPLPCYRRGEDEKSVELTFIGKLQAAAFGTE